jgi:hypothetical protein
MRRLPFVGLAAILLCSSPAALRRAICVVAWLLCTALAAEAATPSLGSQAFKVATVSNETIAITNVDAGAALVVFYFGTASGTRTVTSVTDDCGDTFGAPVQTTASYGSARNVAVFIDYSVTGGTTCTITVDQSGAFTGYSILVVEVNCPTSCAFDVSNTATQATATTHFSAPSGSIDTVADVFVTAGCVGDGNLNTETAGTNFTLLTETDVGLMAEYRASSGALTDERGQMTSSSARPRSCLIGSNKEFAAAPPTRRSLGLMGIGR